MCRGLCARDEILMIHVGKLGRSTSKLIRYGEDEVKHFNRGTQNSLQLITANVTTVNTPSCPFIVPRSAVELYHIILTGVSIVLSTPFSFFFFFLSMRAAKQDLFV